MKFSEFFELITELKINLNNNFEWYRMTPKQCDEWGIKKQEFKKLFYFLVKEYVYIVGFDHSNQFDFWNHSKVDLQNFNDDVLTGNLGLFDDKTTLKIIATIFSIMSSLANDGEIKFIIKPPNSLNSSQRFKIYKKLLKDNLVNFLPDFEMVEKENELILQNKNRIVQNENWIKKTYFVEK